MKRNWMGGERERRDSQRTDLDGFVVDGIDAVDAEAQADEE